MAKNELINVFCFDKEIGRIGFDENAGKSFFQYHPDFLESNIYENLIPQTGIIRRVKQVQVFSQFNNETFKGLPPIFADSLPDLFGNIIFKTWLESNNKNFNQISVIEQLAYVANRGMGALEYKPAMEIPKNTSIDLEEITGVLKAVLSKKEATRPGKLNSQSLLNIFKIGTSAGGARPKILISENKHTGEIMPGDLNTAADFNHYLVKLALDEEDGFEREKVEYAYYKTALSLGINIMPSKLIDNKHFATQRFDRQNGQKKHVLTASGLTGWDFKSPENSSYENLFELAIFLKIPHREIEALYRRMLFNIIFCNTDDHLKNHSFIYNEKTDKWNLAPAYDLNYALHPLINYKRITRALSVNNKRVDIQLNDLLKIAEQYTIKNPKGSMAEIQDSIEIWEEELKNLDISPKMISSMKKDFLMFV
ncbi:MAG: type II toxin-antitoxin system HipA family toxin [Chitinophagales bacterium]